MEAGDPSCGGRQAPRSGGHPELASGIKGPGALTLGVGREEPELGGEGYGGGPTAKSCPVRGPPAPGQAWGWTGKGQGRRTSVGWAVPTTCAGARGTAGTPPALGSPGEPRWPLQTEPAEPRPLRQAPSSNQQPGWPCAGPCFPRDEPTVWAPSKGPSARRRTHMAMGPWASRRPLWLPCPCCPERAPGVRGGWG